MPSQSRRAAQVIRKLSSQLLGEREAFEFSLSACPQRKGSIQSDAITPIIEAAFGVKCEAATLALRQMQVWEAASDEALQVKVSSDPVKTRERFDLVRKIIHPEWIAPAHIAEAAQAWLTAARAMEKAPLRAADMPVKAPPRP